MAWWKVWESKRENGEPKTVHIIQGYFFLFNFCLGTGFLGIPYSFFYSGYLAAIPTLILTAFCAWVTARWLIEIMARAQALESYDQNIEMSTSVSVGNGNQKFMNSTACYQQPMPDYRISIYRKFEISELCKIFVGGWFKYVYVIFLAGDQFLGNWSFASVAASAWASKIPYNFGDITICNESAFHHQLLPQGGCLYSYYFSLFLFGVIVITLSMLDLKEQVIVQVVLGLARLITIAGMVIYSLVKLISAVDGSGACELNPESDDYGTLSNFSNYNGSYMTLYTPLYNTSRDHFTYEDIVLKFDTKGLIVSTPVFLFTFLFHHGISSLAHPVKQKKQLHWMVTAVAITCFLCFLALGVVVPLWFKASVQETITLSWVGLAHGDHPLPLRAFSYYLIFFPSLDVISAYPLTNICIVNNVYTVITGRDTSEPAKWKYDWILHLSMKFIVALIPILLAFASANLVYILSYTGILAFGLLLLFPGVLQLRSTYVCSKKFGQCVAPQAKEDSQPLINKVAKSSKLSCSSWSYMTPYSNSVISHPLFVCLIGCFGACFFVFALVSLFITTDKFTCLS